MAKEITKKQILKLLNKSQDNLSNEPNLWRILTFQKIDTKYSQPEDFDVEVRFQNHNYVSIARDLYDSDSYGMIWDGPRGSTDFSHIPSFKSLIKQLSDDDYISIEKQTVHYNTDYDMQVEYFEEGPQEVYMAADKLFSEEERILLETSIILTTKGQNRFEFWKDKIISEPIGIFSFFVSLASLVISIISIISIYK